ncbi:MAG: threonylcarbamoyl-AMP synthase [Chloroflexi bacterium]|nr:threonylcarbamoyl-AMP synthase [Chloroflexota bacterium]
MEVLETQHLHTHETDAVTTSADWLRQGRLVAFPTDTVYGVGANAFNGAAIERLYRAKQRPFTKGIPILLADLTDLDKVAWNAPAFARQLIERFWPGPLTLILPRHPDLPAIISPNEGIAVRLPDCDAARALIRAAGGAVAATSANRSGDEPARSGVEAMEKLGGLVTAVLDDGPSPGGTPSTILDCVGAAPRILRAGPIAISELLPAGMFA